MLPSAIEGDDVVSDYVWLHVCARVNDIHIPVLAIWWETSTLLSKI